MNEYEEYNEFTAAGDQHEYIGEASTDQQPIPEQDAVDFDDPDVAALPRVLLMGPRRGGKTSIQVCIVFLCEGTKL